MWLKKYYGEGKGGRKKIRNVKKKKKKKTHQNFMFV